MTHEDLVACAGKWLRKTIGCPVVFEELVTLGGEIPDAIGWIGGSSYLVECKSSRADFLADSKKPHRMNPGQGMGNYRYFMAPKGMIKVDELPARWGLLEVDTAGRVSIRAGCHPKRYGEERVSFWHEPLSRAEIWMLVSGLRRLQISLGQAEFKRLVHLSRVERIGPLFDTAAPTERRCKVESLRKGH